MKAAREQRAAARAAAAEAGASGNSSDAVLNDIMMQAGQDISRIEKSQENGVAKTSTEVRARSGEINGQLSASLASSAVQRYRGYSEGIANYIPNLPKSAWYTKPTVTFDEQPPLDRSLALSKLTIGS